MEGEREVSILLCGLVQSRLSLLELINEHRIPVHHLMLTAPGHSLGLEWRLVRLVRVMMAAIVIFDPVIIMHFWLIIFAHIA